MGHIYIFFKFLIMDLHINQYINSWFSQPSNATKSLYRLCSMYAWHISREILTRLSASSKWHLPSSKNYILTLTISHHIFNVPFPHSDELFVNPLLSKEKLDVQDLGSSSPHAPSQIYEFNITANCKLNFISILFKYL